MVSAAPPGSALEQAMRQPDDDAKRARDIAFKDIRKALSPTTTINGQPLSVQQQEFIIQDAFNIMLQEYKKDIVASQALKGTATAGQEPSAGNVVEPEKASFWRRTSFSTIIGMEREQKEIKKALVFPLQYPLAISKVRAILFYGPPGTGKTLIAAATPSAIEAANITPFLFLAKGSTILGKYVGETEKNIEALFNSAEDKVRVECNIETFTSPSTISVKSEIKDGYDTTYEAKIRSCKKISLIFIDEIDAFGSSRNTTAENTARPVNSLIAMMDGARKYEFVVVLGSTNRPFDLDSALLSRFPVKLFVDTLGDIARFDFFQNAIRKRMGSILTMLGIVHSPDTLDGIIQRVAPFIYTDFIAPKSDQLFDLPTAKSESLLYLVGLTGWTDSVIRNNYEFFDTILTKSKDLLDSTTNAMMVKARDKPEDVFLDESDTRNVLTTVREIKGLSYLPEMYLTRGMVEDKANGTIVEAEVEGRKNFVGLSRKRFGYSNRDLDAIFNRFLSKMFDGFLQNKQSRHLGAAAVEGFPTVRRPFATFASAPDPPEIDKIPLFDVVVPENYNASMVREERNKLLQAAVWETSSSVVDDEYVELRFYQRFGNRLNI